MRRLSVVLGRQQLCCAVQSRSLNHCQTTTEKVALSSRRNVVSDGAFLTDDGRLFHARAKATGKARSPSVERLVDGTTIMAVSAERADRVECRRQMSGEGSETALFHEDSGRPERTAGM